VAPVSSGVATLGRADEIAVSWRISTLPSEPDPVNDARAEEILGPDIARWRVMCARNATLAARMLAGRRAVQELARANRAWRGFAPSVPGRKPEFADGIGDFSISHSGNLLLVAVVATGRIGVDLEVDETPFDDPRIVARICSDRELATAAGLAPAARRRWLALLWTAKEAALKVNGHGLSQDPRGIDLGSRIAYPAPGSVAASIAVAADRDAHDLVLRHPEPRSAMVAGLA
jgi:phosphopantetheinyl transferase